MADVEALKEQKRDAEASYRNSMPRCAVLYKFELIKSKTILKFTTPTTTPESVRGVLVIFGEFRGSTRQCRQAPGRSLRW